MGLPIKNYYKTDPPKTLYEFSENNVKSDFFYKICPKCPKKIALKRTKWTRPLGKGCPKKI